MWWVGIVLESAALDQWRVTSRISSWSLFSGWLKLWENWWQNPRTGPGHGTEQQTSFCPDHLHPAPPCRWMVMSMAIRDLALLWLWQSKSLFSWGIPVPLSHWGNSSWHKGFPGLELASLSHTLTLVLKEEDGLKQTTEFLEPPFPHL